MALSQAPKHSQPQTVATSACPKRERERDLHHRHLTLHQGDMASYTSGGRHSDCGGWNAALATCTRTVLLLGAIYVHVLL